jgi:hypothetical protein
MYPYPSTVMLAPVCRMFERTLRLELSEQKFSTEAPTERAVTRMETDEFKIAKCKTLKYFEILTRDLEL